MTTDILALAAAQRAALEARDRAALARLVAAYGELWQRVADKAELLGHDIAALDHPSADQVRRLARYRALLAAIGDELERFGHFAAVDMNAAAVAALGQAGSDAAALVAASAPGIAFDVVPPDTIRALLAFLRPDGPLYARLEQLAPVTTQRVADTIVAKVASGMNPQQWAGAIRDQLGGGLTDALRMARTVELYSYREASRANYAANPDAVTGWYWFAQLDSDTCLSCVAQHGTLHPVSETLNDHHNGRCAMIPAVVGVDNPIRATGEKWFGALPAGQQRAMMGPGKYNAWRDGKFSFGDLSGMRVDSVYGPMRIEATLQELVQ